MSDILTRLRQTQCCDPVIDSLIGAAIEEIAALTAELSEARIVERKALEFGARMEAERDGLRAALEAVEWGGRSHEEAPYCSQCGRLQEFGHTPDCIVGLALGGKA